MTIKIDGTNTAANPGITGSDTDTGLQFGTDEVNIVTGGSTAVTVNSSQLVGIGESSPNAKLDVYSGSGVSAWIRKASNPASIGLATDTTPTTLLEGLAGGGLLFYNATGTIASPSYTERLRIQSNGGISFNGDTAATNALDDYEEGTWTPSVGGDATYSLREGRYTKIGRLVHVSFYLTIDTTTTGSSTDIFGLPFTPLADTGGSSLSYWLNLNSSVCTLVGYIYGSATTIYLYSNTGASTGLLRNSVIRNSAIVQGHLSYFAA
jgi:hypothetical protein